MGRDHWDESAMRYALTRYQGAGPVNQKVGRLGPILDPLARFRIKEMQTLFLGREAQDLTGLGRHMAGKASDDIGFRAL